MSSDVTQASVEAVMDVHGAVQAYGKDMRELVEVVNRDLRKLEQEFVEACQRSDARQKNAAARLGAAFQALRDCRENCAALAAAAQEAQRHFDHAKQEHAQNHSAWKQAQREFSRVQSALGQLDSSAQTDVRAAAISVLEYAKYLNQYLEAR